MADAAALYLDENVSIQVAARLKASGFDVLTTYDADMQGRSDEDQLRFAANNGRIFVTHNIRDFQLLAIDWAKQAKGHDGIVYLPYDKPATICVWIEQLFELYPQPQALQNCTVSLPVAR